MHFTLDDLRDQFDPATFARGEGYARQGKVISVNSDGARVHAEVAGSGGAVYHQTIRAKHKASGIAFTGDCSCPMVRNCKHVVAALLCSLQQAEASTDLSHATQHWLALLGEALTPAPPAPVTSRLIYVLSPAFGGGGPQLDLCKARLRKDGSIGGASIINDLFFLLSGKCDYVQADDEDVIRLVAGLRAANRYVVDTPLSGRLGASVLVRLCEEGRLLWAATPAAIRKGEFSHVQPGPPRSAALDWQANAAGGAVALGWRCDDASPIGQVLATDPPMYLGLHQDRYLLGRLTLPAALAALPATTLQRLVDEAPRLLPAQRAELARHMLAQRFERLLPLPQALRVRERRDIAPVPHLLLDSVAGPQRLWHDHARLAFDYDGVRTSGQGERLQRNVDEDLIETIMRRPDAEQAFQAQLRGLGFSAATPALAGHHPEALQLATPAAWIGFVRDALTPLRQAGWQITLGEHYRYDFHEVEDWSAELREENGEDAGNDWFSLELGILVDGQRHPLLPLLLQMMRAAPLDFDAAAIAARADDADLLLSLPDQRPVRLPWGRVKPILLAVVEMHLSERGDGWRLALTDAARLAELEQAAQLRWVGGERLRELGRKLHHFDGIRPALLPAGLQAQLRPYQHAGLSWMQFLREVGFGGILADDMGLGKTVQTLAHVLAEKEAGRLDCPALVVAPTSLMDNWQSEARRFAPGLRLLLLHGKDRAALFDQMGEVDLVLTSYPLLARDEARLRAQRFHLLILDEAQTIKNSRAKAAQTACLLDARHRLCLTGTPVQNHLGELWSQFHFLMPGLLGQEKSFNALFRKPIEQDDDSAARQALARRIKPFMLRRTKDKVATELPPKTDIVLHVDFGAAQRDLYETVRVAMDRKVRDEIDRRGLARSQIVILDALLKLRQVCCDPRLLKKVAGNAGSAKLDTLMALLDTLLSEGRKVLVFSQFTSMLALIGAQLHERAVDFALLTGDTLDRGTQVARFQSGQVGVFLISLKAGGVGLNLTAADTVIHYDPWWNPASENQATDRAWRIGQTQPVFVYKLIARGTLEEKIQDMQKRKGAIAAAVLDPEGGLAQGLAAADLQAIFAPA